MKIKIGIDTGKTYTKWVVKDFDGEMIRNSFYTTIEESDIKAKTELTKEIEFHGKRYIIGDPNTKLSLINTKERTKETEVHKICFLTAIAEALETIKVPSTETIEVAATINMPMSEFMNKEKRQSFVDYYQTPRFIEIKYNGNAYTFTIAVLPYYEGLGAALLMNEEFKTSRILSLDFGSKNVGYCVFDNMKPVVDECGTLDKGCTRLLTRIKKMLQDNGISNLTSESELLDVIEGNNEFIKNEIVEKARLLVTAYITEIYADLDDLEINVDSTQILCSGGAFNLYAEFIKQVFKSAKIKSLSNAGYANAEGTLKLIK